MCVRGCGCANANEIACSFLDFYHFSVEYNSGEILEFEKPSSVFHAYV